MTRFFQSSPNSAYMLCIVGSLAMLMGACGQLKVPSSNSASMQTSANEFLVRDIDQYNKVAKNIKAGQTIILADGIWQDFEILLSATGSQDKLVRLTAQTEGAVILSGQSNLRLQGEYLEVSGLVFKNGFSPSGEVISFRGDSKNFANHSRVTRTVIDGFSNPDKFSTDYWIAMYGKHNRLDHNHLVGKGNAGVTIAVRLDSEASQENYHRIDHNYFGPRPILGSNGGETLRIGTSKYSLTNSFTTVENNYFDRTNGEVEIISNKSGNNKFLNNVFFESRGTLTLRHGNNNLVEGNVFFGNGKDHTGGIRVINANQTIRNNYMEGLTGIRFGGGFVVLNGVPNSTINRYHQVDNATIENNTIVNVSNINLAAGSDAERTAAPINSRFSKNLVINEKEQPFNLFDDISGVQFADNYTNQNVVKEIAYGFSKIAGELTRNNQGLLVNAQAIKQGIGAAASLTPTSKDITGVSWYPKSGAIIAFNSGKKIHVNTVEQLEKAIVNASDGSEIMLQAGTYALNKTLNISSIITIAGQSKDTVTLFPMRSSMVVLQDGGSLQLSNLTINGEGAPDSAGNVLIKNSRIPTLHNYRLSFVNVNVINLNVNHSAHVFDAGYRSLADSIVIENSDFKNITGDILRLDKEQDDLGIYNAEYITITNSHFSNIEGAVVKAYRGGTDESTFGPHLWFENNTLNNVGAGKRNKSGSSLFLHGVQDTDLIGNTFTNSQAVIIDHTVGEPQTLIKQNQFVNMSLPVVTEVFTKGKSTAVLETNTVSKEL